MSRQGREIPTAGEIYVRTQKVLNAVVEGSLNLSCVGRRFTNFDDPVTYGLKKGHGVETAGFSPNENDRNFNTQIVALTTPEGQTTTLQVRSRRYNPNDSTDEPVVIIGGEPTAIDYIRYHTSGFPAGIEGVHELSQDNIEVLNGKVTSGPYKVPGVDINAFDFFQQTFDEIIK